MLPISAFIIAKDEADRIPRALASLKGWVNEIFVIDSGSTDDTVSVSRNSGAQVVFNAWEGYGPQKVFGEGLCKQNWLLNIDADEEITPELRQEIEALFQKDEPKHKAYSFPIKDQRRFSSQKPGIFAPSHVQIRLYHKQYAGFKTSTVHDSVILKDSSLRVGKLKAMALHRSFRSYSHAVEKINRYSSMQAEDMFKKGRKPSWARVMGEPFIAFLKGYFLKRYFLLGFEGVMESMIYAFSRILRLLKTRELFYQEENREK